MGLPDLKRELQAVDVPAFNRAHIDASHRLGESAEELEILWEAAASEFPFMRAFLDVQQEADQLHGRTREDAIRYTASFMTFCVAVKEMIDADELRHMAQGQ